MGGKEIDYYVQNLRGMKEKEGFMSQYSSKGCNSNSHKPVFVKIRVTGCMHVPMGMQLWDLNWIGSFGPLGKSSAALGQPPHQNSWHHLPQLRTCCLETMHSGKTLPLVAKTSKGRPVIIVITLITRKAVKDRYWCGWPIMAALRGLCSNWLPPRPSDAYG